MKRSLPSANGKDRRESRYAIGSPARGRPHLGSTEELYAQHPKSVFLDKYADLGKPGKQCIAKTNNRRLCQQEKREAHAQNSKIQGKLHRELFPKLNFCPKFPLSGVCPSRNFPNSKFRPPQEPIPIKKPPDIQGLNF